MNPINTILNLCNVSLQIMDSPMSCGQLKLIKKTLYLFIYLFIFVVGDCLAISCYVLLLVDRDVFKN